MAVAAGTVVVSGCATSQYRQVACSGMSRQSIFLLEAQAVPSATLIPCALPLPGGWSYGGSEVRSGLARFWLDSDRAGAHAAEVRLTQACDVAGATPLPPALPAPRSAGSAAAACHGPLLPVHRRLRAVSVRLHPADRAGAG